MRCMREYIQGLKGRMTVTAIAVDQFNMDTFALGFTICSPSQYAPAPAIVVHGCLHGWRTNQKATH